MPRRALAANAREHGHTISPSPECGPRRCNGGRNREIPSSELGIALLRVSLGVMRTAHALPKPLVSPSPGRWPPAGAGAAGGGAGASAQRPGLHEHERRAGALRVRRRDVHGGAAARGRCVVRLPRSAVCARGYPSPPAGQPCAVSLRATRRDRPRRTRRAVRAHAGRLRLQARGAPRRHRRRPDADRRLRRCVPGAGRGGVSWRIGPASGSRRIPTTAGRCRRSSNAEACGAVR